MVKFMFEPPLRTQNDQREPFSDSVIVVGIGASAGGLEALKQLIGTIPVDSGLAYVLVQHLDPNHESLMVDLLAHHTHMPVLQVENSMLVQANHMYVIPPNTYMSIHAGVLHLSEPTAQRGRRMAIDAFFRSLANDRYERAICIILSGTGSDGALGLRAIKEHGGMAMVQTPESAQYDGMPRSSIVTGLVDYVLPLNEMVQTLLAYVNHYYHQIGNAPPRMPDRIGADFLEAALALVRLQTNIDFRSYKQSTLLRRIERRMSIRHLTDSREYLRFLQQMNKRCSCSFAIS